MGILVNGTPQRKHIENAAAQGSARAIATLEGAPEPPDTLLYLWGWFLQLASGRSQGMMGSANISFQDVDAWARLMDQSPQPYEVEALMMMDVTWRNAQSEGK